MCVEVKKTSKKESSLWSTETRAACEKRVLLLLLLLLKYVFLQGVHLNFYTSKTNFRECYPYLRTRKVNSQK